MKDEIINVNIPKSGLYGLSESGKIYKYTKGLYGQDIYSDKEDKNWEFIIDSKKREIKKSDIFSKE